MKEFKQYGAYGIIIESNKVLLINKKGGPYNGKLDLPGGTIEFCERPRETLIREFLEETGLEVKSFELFDADSVSFDWKFKEVIIKVHHIGIFYKIKSYKNKIKNKIEIDEKNDDSLGASFYNISDLKEENLSKIAYLALKKLGYEISK